MDSIYFLYILTFLFTLLLAKFGFSKHYELARNYNLVKGSSRNTKNKALVYTGAGLVFSFMLLIEALVLNNVEYLFFEKMSLIISASVLVSVIGLYSDFQNLSLLEKYIPLSFLIAMTVYSGNSSEGDFGIITNLNGFFGIYDIAYSTGFFFTCFLYLYIISLINLIDRIDGYVSIFCSLLFLALFFINDLNRYYTHSIVSVVFIASMIVFLKHNFSRRKKLFFGDSGSFFFGFWIANFLVLFITTSEISNITNVFSIQLENVPVLAIASINIPVLETLRLTILRIIDKRSLFSADRNQIYYILIDKNISDFNISLILCMINTINLILIFLMEPYFNSIELTIIYISISLFWFGFFEYLKRN